MDKKLSELENLLSMQDSFYAKLLELGLIFENSVQPDKAFDIYKKGLEKVERTQLAVMGAMLGLLD